LSELWSGQVEDDNAALDVSDVLRPYVTVARATGAAILLLYHTNKGGREYRGSGAIGAVVDAPLTLVRRRSGGEDDNKILPAGTIADEDTEDDGRRVILGTTRWGRLALHLTFDGTSYVRGTKTAPLAERVMWALRDGKADSGSTLASVLRVRKGAALRIVSALKSQGFVEAHGRQLRVTTAGVNRLQGDCLELQPSSAGSFPSDGGSNLAPVRAALDAIGTELELAGTQVEPAETDASGVAQ
jgi:hypothetical protein